MFIIIAMLVLGKLTSSDTTGLKSIIFYRI